MDWNCTCRYKRWENVRILDRNHEPYNFRNYGRGWNQNASKLTQRYIKEKGISLDTIVELSMYVQLMMIMMTMMMMTTTTSIRPHHVAQTLITTGIVPSCPVDRNWLLCCHENFWRAIKDKTKWYPSNKEQPPSVTGLWQHCRGGLQAWCVWSFGLAATVAQIAKMNVSVATYSTTFRSSKVRPLLCFEMSGSDYPLTQRHTPEEWDLAAPPYLVHFTDIRLTHYGHTTWGQSVAHEFDGLLMLMEETRHACRILLGNFCFKICSLKAQERYRTILIDHWFMYKLYNGIMILGAG